MQRSLAQQVAAVPLPQATSVEGQHTPLAHWPPAQHVAVAGSLPQQVSVAFGQHVWLAPVPQI
jgi:hypothetical protein